MSTPLNIDIRLTAPDMDKVVPIMYLPGIRLALLEAMLDQGWSRLKAELLKIEAEKEQA